MRAAVFLLGALCALPARAEVLIHMVKSTRTISVLDSGKVLASFSATFGHKGDGPKRKQGDGLTPEGRYRLSPPRASKKFGRFALIGYPTRKQRARAYTGSAVGLHGTGSGSAKTFFQGVLQWMGIDWTDGCIAVSNEDMDELEALVEKYRIRTILITSGEGQVDEP